MRICKFSNDSEFIYCGDNQGFLYVYDIKQNYKEIYENKVHKHSITSIDLINN